MVNESTNPVREQTFYAVSRDGWQLAIHQHEPAHQTISDPILLVHGLGANRYNLDAPGRYSLARYLARSGGNCFVAELRGAGESTRPMKGTKFEWEWGFDDYALKDLPAIVETILLKTGSAKLHWIGHSMGGMLGYACAGGTERERVRSMVTIGSPCFTHNSNLGFDLGLYLRPIAKHLKSLPYEGLGHLLLPILPLFRDTVGRVLANPRNMDLLGLQGILRKAPSSLPISLLFQFAHWHEVGGASLANGHRLTHLLTEIQAPTMLIIGTDDRLASVEGQQAIFQLLPTAKKELLILSSEHGCRYDYGHVDPILGYRAEYEVWPHLLRWLRTHDADG